MFAISSSRKKYGSPGRKSDGGRTHPKKLEESWINELVGDRRIFLKKPSAWRSIPRIGMDKIRAKTDTGKYFVNFASSSSVHGFNHLTAPHRHPVERVLAAIFIGGALVFLILLSLNFWDRWQNDAVISILDNDYRNFSITEPSVLLCPLVKYDETKFSSVFQSHGIEDTEEARNFFHFLAQASYTEFADTPLYEAVPPEKWLPVLWDLKSDVRTDSPLQTATTWIVTDKGFCLFFFTHVGVYASYQYWMENNWTVVPVPVELPSYSYAHRDRVKTLNILTHSVVMRTFHPMEIGNPEKSGLLIGQRHHMTIEITPKEIKTSAAVKHLSIKQRKCKQPEEADLKTWPIYTQFMCTQECKAELARQLCGCYPHFSRPMPGVPVCTAKQLRCLGEHHRKFVAVYITAGKRCGCLPNCDTATYEEGITSDAVLKEGSPNDAFMNYHIYFPTLIIRRELLFGFTDFLTSVGGAAGLFLGASVISFVEIIYYATLHLFWYRAEIRRKRKEKLRMQKIIVQRKNYSNLFKY